MIEIPTRDLILRDVELETPFLLVIAESPSLESSEFEQTLLDDNGAMLLKMLELFNLQYVTKVSYLINQAVDKPSKKQAYQCYRDYLFVDIAYYKPQYILLLGNFVSKFFLKTDNAISTIQGVPYHLPLELPETIDKRETKNRKKLYTEKAYNFVPLQDLGACLRDTSLPYNGCKYHWKETLSLIKQRFDEDLKSF